MSNNERQVPVSHGTTGALTKSQIRKQNKLAWQRSLTVLVVDPDSTTGRTQSSDSTTADFSQSHSQASLPSPPNTPLSSVAPSYSHVAHATSKGNHHHQHYHHDSLPPSPSSDHPVSAGRPSTLSPSKRAHPYALPPGYHAPQPNSRRQRAKRRREEQQAWQNEWFKTWTLNNLQACLTLPQIPSTPTTLSPYGPTAVYQDPTLPLSPSYPYKLCNHEHIASMPSSSPFFSQQTPSFYR